MAKLNPKEPSDFLKVRVEIPEPTKEILFTVPAAMKAGALKALSDIRVLFGPSGQYWIQGDEHETFNVGDLHPITEKPIKKAFDGYCLIGGIHAVDGRYEGIARAAISLAILEYQEQRETELNDVEDVDDGESLQSKLLDSDHITYFNDWVGWKSINAVLKLAVKLVKEAPVK